MSEETKARKWFLEQTSGVAWRADVVIKPSSTSIHVIEYSAYRALGEENERLDAQNKRLRVDSKLTALHECEEKLIAERAKCQDYERALKDVLHCFEHDDYRCNRCDKDPEMLNSNAAYYTREVLAKHGGKK